MTPSRISTFSRQPHSTAVVENETQRSKVSDLLSRTVINPAVENCWTCLFQAVYEIAGL